MKAKKTSDYFSLLTSLSFGALYQPPLWVDGFNVSVSSATIFEHLLLLNCACALPLSGAYSCVIVVNAAQIEG